MDLITLLILFMAVELFESNWQKHESLHGLIYNNFSIYQRNIFLYFILHVSFFYAIFLSIYLNKFDFYILSIIGIKFLDVALKLTMMQKLSQDVDINEIMPINMKMTPLFRYFNVLVYPATFAISVGLLF